MGKWGFFLQKKAESLLKIAAIYLGTVLGAGFASGQELLLFFVRFSRRGLVGCLLAVVLFCLLGALILGESYELKDKTHRAYLSGLFGRRFAAVTALITEVFLCISFCIMLSGAGAFFRERLSLPPIVGILVTDALCLLVFLYDLQGLSLLNLLLTPFMLLGTLCICVYTIVTDASPVFLSQIHPHGRFLPYALFYVGYNILTATAVLVPSAALAPDKKTAACGGILGGLLLGIMAFVCCFALFITPELHDSPLPMLQLSKQAGNAAYICYSVVLYMAMLTTAVSTGFSVQQRLVTLGMKPKSSTLIICLGAIPLSMIEFSVLVERCYVFFGILGMLIMLGILWKWFKNKV